ncbi:ATP-binding cassette domain-containing protein [Fundicoccus sp. Sow4_F4]|uniref:ABC transporter ATP-binding protein n=1 Tax=Fundicoccus sp. Sow4_F4 TaxID=3438783 RepID=UPI003F8ED137
MTQPFVIETIDLTKRFGTHRGIEDVNIRVAEGDFYGFIGPNGSGKSTTIRLLLGLISPSAGKARLFSELAGPNQTDVLARIGYMPSEAVFYKGMSVREVIRLSADLRGKAVREACQLEAKRLCDLFQVDTHKKVEELSLGNRKKVSIICALQHQPELYILDEPTSGLDPFMQKLFWQELTERNRQGATVFVSSHILSEVQRYCQRAAIIQDGRIVIDDTVQRLIQTTAKRVTIHGRGPVDLDLADMKDVLQAEDSLSFLYNGDIQLLLKALYQQRGEMLDVSIVDPDMDEVFMHYYENAANSPQVKGGH